jgi:hypothetical protein
LGWCYLPFHWFRDEWMVGSRFNNFRDFSFTRTRTLD